MKKFLLDTNFCISFLKGENNLDEQLKKVGFKNCSISEVTLAELKYQAECSEQVAENLVMVDEFSKAISVVPIYNSLSIYANEKARLRKKGELIDDFDILIGTSAVVNDLVLVTENEKNLGRISKIKIENWMKPQ